MTWKIVHLCEFTKTAHYVTEVYCLTLKRTVTVDFFCLVRDCDKIHMKKRLEKRQDFLDHVTVNF